MTKIRSFGRSFLCHFKYYRHWRLSDQCLLIFTELNWVYILAVLSFVVWSLATENFEKNVVHVYIYSHVHWYVLKTLAQGQKTWWSTQACSGSVHGLSVGEHGFRRAHPCTQMYTSDDLPAKIQVWTRTAIAGKKNVSFWWKVNIICKASEFHVKNTDVQKTIET